MLYVILNDISHPENSACTYQCSRTIHFTSTICLPHSAYHTPALVVQHALQRTPDLGMPCPCVQRFVRESTGEDMYAGEDVFSVGGRLGLGFDGAGRGGTICILIRPRQLVSHCILFRSPKNNTTLEEHVHFAINHAKPPQPFECPWPHPPRPESEGSTAQLVQGNIYTKWTHEILTALA